METRVAVIAVIVENEDAVTELNALLMQCISKMPPQRQLIFRMSRYEHLSNREIAEQLNISVKTVEAQITKALKTIRSYITDKMVLLWMFF